MAVPGRNFRFSIDRGGTFTDVYAEVAHPGGRTSFRVLKLLSEDPAYVDQFARLAPATVCASPAQARSPRAARTTQRT